MFVCSVILSGYYCICSTESRLEGEQMQSSIVDGEDETTKKKFHTSILNRKFFLCN